MAYPYGGLSSYGGGFVQQNYQPVNQSAGGLAGYGQSMSSEQIDLSNAGLSGYNGYTSAAAAAGGGGGGGVPAVSSYGSPYNSGAIYGSQYMSGNAYGSQFAQGAAYSGYGAQNYGSSYGYSAPNYGSNYAAPNYQQGQLDTNDPQLVQQIEQIVSSLTEVRRPMLRRQVITVPANCPGRVTCITRRLPTPPPDVIERITVIKPPRDVVNLCIEKPYQPGPCFQQREICGKPRKPLIQPRVVSVPPRSNPCAQQASQPLQSYIQPQPQSFCGSQQMSSYAQQQQQPYYGGVQSAYNGYGGYGVAQSYGNSSYFGNGNPVC
jgi:hypothetical protein